jgi:Tfp pilus assembly protein PilX
VGFRVPLPDRLTRAGIAAPLAVIMLIAVALLGLLMMEGALNELRTGAAAVAESRVAARAESALAQALVQPLDTSALSRPPGSVLLEEASASPDSTILRIAALGQGLVRLTVRVSSGDRHLRVYAGRIALLGLRTDSAVPSQVRMVPIKAHWWVASP